MATQLTSNTFSGTYKDDFADSAGYHRILFNSGRSLQARELTQMQTILQNQISRMGNNIFKEGSVVKEGAQALNNGYEFIKLNTDVEDLPATPSSLVGVTYTGATSLVEFKIIEVVEKVDANNPATLYVQYTSTVNSSAATTAPIRMTPGETITSSSGKNLIVQTTNTTANPAVGRGIRYSIDQGIYFVKGFFVFTERQSKILSKYSDTFTGDVGYKITEEIHTISDDTSLYDNQGSTPNIAAPGADRLKISLTLIERSELAADENFLQVARIEDGALYRTIDTNDAYNIPNDLIATRIKENSGDYTVKQFKAYFDLDSANTHLLLKVSDGVVVVDGYRAARFSPTDIRVPKSTDTITEPNEFITVDYGNYVIVDPAQTSGLPNINVFEQFNICGSSTTYDVNNKIGTCRVRHISEDGANYRYHLFDIVMNSGSQFEDAKVIGLSSTDFFRPTLTSGRALRFETNKNSMLFPLPQQRPKELDVADITLTIQERLTGSFTSNSASISTSTGTLTNTGDWLVSANDSAIETDFTVSGLSGGTATITATNGVDDGSNYEFLVNTSKTGVVRTKTLETTKMTGTVVESNGTSYISLTKPDIFNLVEVVNKSDSSESYAARFALDNGQRDNFYDTGRLVLKGGQSAPAGTIHIEFTNFTHGTSGDFFAVNSYAGQVEYKDIPDFADINLRDFIDFRPVKNADGTFSGNEARVSMLPQPTSTIQAGITYYLSKAGKLVIDTGGNLQFVEGTSGIIPSIPYTPDRTLALHDVILNPNTLHDSDVYIQPLYKKRYTMDDINKLEQRIDRVEEFATLGLLETETENLVLQDSAGSDRLKAGFLVDNFSTQLLSDVTNPDYSAAIDPLYRELHPSFREDNIRLIFDSDNSSGVVKKGDNIYLAHTEVSYIDQSVVSQAEQINPFAVVTYEGTITLSPSSDEWRETEYTDKKIIDGGTKLNTDQAKLWNNHNWGWGGVPIEQLTVGSKTNKKVSENSSSKTTVYNKVVSEETVLEYIQDVVLYVTLIPYMRSKKIFFKATGLAPSQKVFAFFDGTNVENFVREETFEYYADNPTDYGNTQFNATEHPESKSALTTDANGNIEGSFFIPNTASLKFKTGIREFKILNISVNNEDDATSFAKALYASTGYLDTTQQEYLSTRILHVQGKKTVVEKPKPPTNKGGGNKGGGGTYTNTNFNQSNNYVFIRQSGSIPGGSAGPNYKSSTSAYRFGI